MHQRDDEWGHGVVWASALCGVCLEFMGTHASGDNLMVTDTFRVPHGLMTTGTRMQNFQRPFIIILPTAEVIVRRTATHGLATVSKDSLHVEWK